MALVGDHLRSQLRHILARTAIRGHCELLGWRLHVFYLTTAIIVAIYKHATLVMLIQLLLHLLVVVLVIRNVEWCWYCLLKSFVTLVQRVSLRFEVFNNWLLLTAFKLHWHRWHIISVLLFLFLDKLSASIQSVATIVDWALRRHRVLYVRDLGQWLCKRLRLFLALLEHIMRIFDCFFLLSFVIFFFTVGVISFA